MMYCSKCVKFFEGHKRTWQDTYKCPECSKSEFVVRADHPFAKIDKVNICVLCGEGLMVKCDEIPDPRGNAHMELKMCNSCGHKKAYPKK